MRSSERCGCLRCLTGWRTTRSIRASWTRASRCSRAGRWSFQARHPDAMLIPFSVSRFTVYRRPRGTVWCHARVEGGGRAEAGELIGGDLRIFDEQGLVAEIVGFRARMANREAVRLSTHSRREEARYEVSWKPAPEARPVVPAPLADKRPWVLLMDAQGVGERLGRMLEEHGAPVLRVRPEGFARVSIETLVPARCAGVVYLWGMDQRLADDASAESVQRAALEASGGALHLVKGLAGRDEAPPVWIVTRGAQAVKDTREGLALAQAPLWGLGRVIDLEQPELRCTRVDLDPEDLEGSVRMLYAELGSGGGTPEREVAFREGVRLYPVLRKDTGSRAAIPLRADATYLVTGGLGGLGLEVARWMVEQGARHLVLVGRRAPSAQASEAVRALEQAGAHVTVTSVDVAHEAEVARMLQGIDANSPPLRGIVHSAGVLDDGAIPQQDLERFERVMTPKVAGAWNLHRLTAGRPLDFFVLFSSASAMLGSRGQANYAAANTFLDALAHERRARGLVAQSLDWGPWAETGMVGAPDGSLARALERRGIRPLATRQALTLFGEALASGRPQLALMSVHWPVYLEVLGAKGRSAFYEALAPARPAAGPHAAVASSQPRHPIAERLKAALPHERPQVLASSLQEEVARILRLEPTQLDWRQGFAEMGMDSLMAIELRNVLQKGLGVSVPATVALDHPTIDFLVQHLLENVLKLEVQEPRAKAPETKPVPAAEPEGPLAESLDALSDAELARLVAEDLAKDS
ncbi:type I polyketide synthase [Archangium gephyra]|uniref:type I polyketide synthase n=1 Tax=Archangium gephyra TaxID=48 RepID=UPI003B7A9350